MTSPFLYSVVRGRIVRNGPPQATQPEKRQRKAPTKKQAPHGPEAKW